MQPESKPPSPSPIQIKVLSYNTLIEKYTFTPTVKNDPAWRSFTWAARREQLILKMVSESPDVICLQEIRHVSRFYGPNFADFYQPLSAMGFDGVFGRRNIGGEFGEEGLAIFYNRQLYRLVKSEILYYQDGTGRHALAVTLRSHSGCIFVVATTHLIYPSQIEQAQKQIETLSEWSCLLQGGLPCILAGDFNLCQDVSGHRPLLAKLEGRFNDCHVKIGCRKGSFSLNLTGSNCPGMIPQLMPTRIDYIFASKDIEIVDAQVVGNMADLPTNAEPSDHLPVTSTLRIPCLYNPVIDDIKKLQQVLAQVRERNYATSPKYSQFLNLFWLLPQSIKNAAYDLTYRKAVKLGIYEENVQFGRIAFTNNTFHIEAIFDQEGNSKNIRWEVVKRDLIPIEVIMQILEIIEQRVSVIPTLIKYLNQNEGNLVTFLQKFDDKLHIETIHMIYGETYKIACEKGRNTQHMEYGRVSFRECDGWTLQNAIRVQAMKRLQLP